MSMTDDTLQIINDAPTQAELLKKSKATNEMGMVKANWSVDSTINIYFEPVARVGKGFGFDYEIAGIKEKKLYYALLMPDVDIEINDKLRINEVEYVVFDVNKFPDHIEAYLTKEMRANL